MGFAGYLTVYMTYFYDDVSPSKSFFLQDYLFLVSIGLTSLFWSVGYLFGLVLILLAAWDSSTSDDLVSYTGLSLITFVLFVDPITFAYLEYINTV